MVEGKIPSAWDWALMTLDSNANICQRREVQASRYTRFRRPVFPHRKKTLLPIEMHGTLMRCFSIDPFPSNSAKSNALDIDPFGDGKHEWYCKPIDLVLAAYRAHSRACIPSPFMIPLTSSSLRPNKLPQFS